MLSFIVELHQPMTMTRNLALYLTVLLVFAAGVYVALDQGRKLNPPPAALEQPGLSSAAEPSAFLLDSLKQHLRDPLTGLFIQVILILMTARVCGAAARRAGQPAVVGEMLAGILLGPSLLGWLLPGVQQFVFPASSLGTLRLLSQIGVCLFMFVVGMELDLRQVRHQARTAVLVSQVSILFPYLLGIVVSLLLFSNLAGPRSTFVAFALFLGISMSVTAFPVLARILDERGLTKTALGSTAIACAATNDVTAWCVLAIVVAVAKAGSAGASVLNIGLVVVFVAFMWLWIKPWMSRGFEHAAAGGGTPGKGLIAGVLIFVFACALATELLGIHALFGAFLAGVAMPVAGELRESLRIRLEHFSSVFLLPLFFALTGLRTQIGLLGDPSGWLVCLGLILVATLGKLGGAMVTARMTGMSWLDSISLGALMNTRGLIELIALNIGYDMGILSPRIFAMLVVMALVTTAMTGPLLSLAECLRGRKNTIVAQVLAVRAED